jgi:hypothetical protein
MGVGTERHAPAVLPPEKKTQYPLYRKLGRPQRRSGRVRKTSPPTGIRSPARPGHSQASYRLSYAGPRTIFNKAIYFKKCLLKLADIFKEKSHSRHGRFTPGKELSVPEVPEPVRTVWRRWITILTLWRFAPRFLGLSVASYHYIAWATSTPSFLFI